MFGLYACDRVSGIRMLCGILLPPPIHLLFLLLTCSLSEESKKRRIKTHSGTILYTEASKSLGCTFLSSQISLNSLLSFYFQFSSVTQLCLTLCDPMNHSTPGLPVHHQLPEFTQKLMSMSWWWHPTIPSSVIPFSSYPQSFSASGSFQMIQLFAWGGQSIGVRASASVLPMNTQDGSPFGWTVGSPCSPRDSQESSSIPWFKSINSLVLTFLYSPTLTSAHDYWKNHSLD